MSNFTLERDNRAALAEFLSSDSWIIACLCAAWCDVCSQYRPNFEQLATRHPDKHFVWIDIEDQADMVGDLDTENFPTLLIQRGDTVAFYGTVAPDARIAERLFMAQTEKSDAQLHDEATGSAQHQEWQTDCNLRRRLMLAIDR